jgi:GNAT superfamily N-acetyltransferase
LIWIKVADHAADMLDRIAAWSASMNAVQVPKTIDMDYPRWSEILSDHSHVVIRPINRLDKAAERAFIDELTPEAKRFRFLGQVGSPSERMIEQFTDIDYVNDVAFVAVIPDDSRETIVGVSRYCTNVDGLRCDCAVTVSEHWQHKGLGSVLMKHLIEVARSHGVGTMYSIDSAENQPMKDLASFLGFHTREDPDDSSQVIHELQL